MFVSLSKLCTETRRVLVHLAEGGNAKLRASAWKIFPASPPLWHSSHLFFPAAPTPNPASLHHYPHPHLDVKCIYTQKRRGALSGGSDTSDLLKNVPLSDVCKVAHAFWIKPGQCEAVGRFGPALAPCGEYLSWTSTPLWATWESDLKQLKRKREPKLRHSSLETEAYYRGKE